MRSFYLRVLMYQSNTNMRTAKFYKFILSPFGIPLFFFLLLASKSLGQASIPNSPTKSVLIDFESTLAGVNNGAFTAPTTISVNTPGVGQLNRNAWSFQNTTTPTTTAANFTTDEGNGRGILPSYAPNTTGNQGWYSFNTANLNGTGTNRVLGWQPGAGGFDFANDASPRAITLRVQNNTGSTVNRLDIAYKIIEMNNLNGTNRVRLYTSTNNATYTEQTGAQFVSTNNAPGAITIRDTDGSGPLRGIEIGTTTIIRHANNANSAVNVGDIITFDNAVVGMTEIRGLSGVVLSKTISTTEVNINSTGFTAYTNGTGAASNPGGTFAILSWRTANRAVSLSGLSIPNGGFFFIRWYLDGTGQDELALDDISITADPVGFSIPNNGVAYVIDFDNTINGVNNGQFAAASTFSVASPVAGQLDREAWAFVNDGDDVANAVPFGVDGTGGQGIAPATPATVGGWYAVETTPGDRALGVKPVAAFGTRGSVTLRINNTTGGTVFDYRIAYSLWVRNGTNNSTRVRVYLSQTNAAGSYVEVTSVDYTSPGTADTDGWQGRTLGFTVRGVNSAPFNATFQRLNGEPLFVRFMLDSGDADRDEIALDNISVISAAGPINSQNPNRGYLWAYDGFDYYNGVTPLSDIDGDGVADAPFKGIATRASSFATFPINLDDITTGNPPQRFATTNSPFSLGWAGDWRHDADNNNRLNRIVVTRGRETGTLKPKPSIPITSDDESISLVNSGMYAESNTNPATIGRRLQTSTAGFAFQYTATSPTAPNPCITKSPDCPAISPIRHNNDVRVVGHLTVNGGASAANRTHTLNTRFGAAGSTVWVGVMLRKNFNNDQPVYISLHKKGNVFDVSPGTTNADGTIQIGYFGTPSNSGGHRHWGVRVNGATETYYHNFADIDTRITTQTATSGSQPDAGTIEERYFDLLVARIDFAQGTTPSLANLSSAVTTYPSNHRIRLYVIRDVSRDGTTPNSDAYPVGNPLYANNIEFIGGTIPTAVTSIRFHHATGQNASIGVGSQAIFGSIKGLTALNGLTGTVSAINPDFTEFSISATNFTGQVYPVLNISNIVVDSPTQLTITHASGDNGSISLGDRLRLSGIVNTATVNGQDWVVIGKPNTTTTILQFVSGTASGGGVEAPATAKATLINNGVANISNNPGINPKGYVNTGANFRLFANGLPDVDDDFVDDDLDVAANIDVEATGISSAIDISFHSVAFNGGGAGESAIDEFRIGRSFNQAALNSPVVSLIRGLCSANGGSTGSQVYEGGDFGSAQCMDNNGNIIACPGGTTTSNSNNGTLEVFGTDGVWAETPTVTPNLPTLNSNSYASNTSAVIFAPGARTVFPGGPTYRTLSGGQYVYVVNQNNAPNDGAYTVATQSRHLFGPAWIPFFDNSPRRNGFLMNINATYTRGKFFDQTVTGLCPDTQYEFSIDIINVLRPTRTITNDIPGTFTYPGAVNVATRLCDPNVEPGCQQFSFAGTSPFGGSIGIGAVTDNIPGGIAYSLNPEVDFALNDIPIYTVPVSIANDASWRRVGLTFVTKANLSSNVNLSVRNLAPGGMGNDLSIDNISFRPCGSFSFIIDETTLCTDGRIRVRIGKAGAGLSNARVRWQKWTPTTDDTNSNGLPDDNEWIVMGASYPGGQNNLYDGLDYSDVPVISSIDFYETALMPVTPVGIGQAITPTNVLYPNGTLFRAIFAGNSANLDNEKCRFIVPTIPVNCSILSAKDINLTAAKKIDGVQLYWEVRNEDDKITKYELERSLDARVFVPIADYAPKGRPDELTRYGHLDGAPFMGKSYYRVKMVKEGRAFEYSNIVSVDWDGTSGISIYPNPADDKLHIALSDDFAANQEVKIRLIDMVGVALGNQVYSLDAGQRTLTLDTKNLQQGLYFLEIRIGSLEKIVHKVVIKH